MDTRSSHPATPAAAELLSQGPFLERLARRLVRDEHAARDLVQATFAAALERPPRHRANLRAWLGLVMRRAAARGRHRERALELAEEPAAREAAETAHVAALLAAAVRELEPRYRTVVVLRFYEGLAPRAIAARLGLPVSTVSTRLSRALAQLRGQLDGEFGRERWSGALLFFLRRRTAADSVAPSHALLLGTSAVLAVLALIAVTFRAPQAPPFAAERVARGETTSSSAELEPPASASPDRRALSSPAPPETLAVYVLTPAGEPDPGAAVQALAHGPAGRMSLATVGFTDADGLLELSLRPELVIEGDVSLAGLVGLHAISRTRTPSELTFVERAAGEAALRVGEPGAVVCGRVRGTDGAPIAGALVTVGGEGRLRERDGVLSYAIPRSVLSEADGAFAVHQVPPGAHEVRASAAGLAPGRAWWSSSVGGALELVLTRGAELAGVVRDGAGRPVAGARVWLSRAAELGESVAETRADDDGAYVLAALPPGAMWVHASAPGSSGLSATRAVTLRAGERVDWSPELRANPPLELRIVDARGEPLAEWELELRDAEGSWTRSAVTDAAGELLLRAYPDRPLDLLSRGPRVGRGEAARPMWLARGVEAGGGGLELVVPSDELGASIAGELLDGEGHTALAAWLVARPRGSEAERVALPLGAGAFELDALGAGPHELRLFVPPLGGLDLGERELAAGERCELGRIELPPRGRVRVIGEWRAGDRLELAHYAHGGSWTVRVLFARPDAPLEQLAGDLRAVLRRDGAAHARRIHLEPGEETLLDLDALGD